MAFEASAAAARCYLRRLRVGSSRATSFREAVHRPATRLASRSTYQHVALSVLSSSQSSEIRVWARGYDGGKSDGASAQEEEMTDNEMHDCQPPHAESIGQIWTCPVCGDAWRVDEGAPIGGDAYTWVRGESPI